MVMLTNIASIPQSLFQGMVQPKSKGKDLNRLISAAVVNQGFCNMLLANPESAVSSGFNGEAFCLGTEEQDLVMSIRAASLSEFAMQLVNHQNGKNNGNRRKF
jgi:hypothetical protein